MLCGGEGGTVMGSIEDIEAVRKWIDPESDLPWYAAVPNAKMPDICCALARAQLGRLSDFLNRRAQIAHLYDESLERIADRVLRARPDSCGTWWRYLVAVKCAASVVENARNWGVQFSQPVAMRHWSEQGSFFPVSDHLVDCLVSVPIYPSLSEVEIEHIVMTLHKVVSKI
jgi:dTDP-4-amino-4,6-dideoxygalactose transaminase